MDMYIIDTAYVDIRTCTWQRVTFMKKSSSSLLRVSSTSCILTVIENENSNLCCSNRPDGRARGEHQRGREGGNEDNGTCTRTVSQVLVHVCN